MGKPQDKRANAGDMTGYLKALVGTYTGIKFGVVEEETDVEDAASWDTTVEVPANSIILAVTACVTEAAAASTTLPGTFSVHPKSFASDEWVTGLDDGVGAGAIGSTLGKDTAVPTEQPLVTAATKLTVTPASTPDGTTAGKVYVAAYYINFTVATTS